MSNRDSDFVVISAPTISVVCVEKALHKLYAHRGINWEIESNGDGVVIIVSFSVSSQNQSQPLWNATKSEIENLAMRFHKEDIESI